MKSIRYFFLPTFILILILSSTSIKAAKGSFEIWVAAGEYNHGTFTIEKDYPIVKMRVRVFEGGPVSVFILDENKYNTWTSGGEVIAYAGGKNISSTTIKGQLGLAYSNSTGEQVSYYVVVDNRGNDYYSNVKIDVIITVPSFSALFAFFVLIPLAYVTSKRRK
ncbi:MAG: hypothetical protein ACTSSG_12525 [Candidatus Heimdallarchaeaceae archaeon]